MFGKWFARRSPAKHYVYAVVLSLAAYGARIALDVVGVSSTPYLLFFFATFTTAAIGGLWPGLFASLLCVFLSSQLRSAKGWYILIDPSDQSAPFRFLLIATSVSVICEYLIRSRERANRAEALMRESEERFRLIANSAPVMIWLAGADKQIFWLNDLWLKFRGRTMEQEVGKGWMEGIHPEDLKRCLDTYDRNFDERLPFTLEYRLRDKDRSWRWVLDRGIPRYGAQHEFLGFIGSCFEIEDLKRAEQALQWANADLEQFAFSASHDLREPIRNIAIHSELVGNRFAHLVDADGQKSLDYVIQGARRLDTLVSDLLKYTTVSRVGDPVESVDADVSLLNVLAMLATAIRESGATISHDRLPKLRIRGVHLEQLLQNLIGNSLKYRSEEQPRVHVSALRLNHLWRISVADNGIGIEPRHQQNIFGLFKRLHRAENYPGTGLGLAICQRIVHLYGGQIWVESGKGNGATFHFTLPGAEDPPLKTAE